MTSSNISQGTYPIDKDLYAIGLTDSSVVLYGNKKYLDGFGPVTAAQVLNRYGSIEALPDTVMGKQRDLALLFKRLATLVRDAPLYRNVDALQFRGPTPAFGEWAERMNAPKLLERAQAARGTPAPTRKRSRAGGKSAA